MRESSNCRSLSSLLVRFSLRRKLLPEFASLDGIYPGTPAFGGELFGGCLPCGSKMRGKGSKLGDCSLVSGFELGCLRRPRRHRGGKTVLRSPTSSIRCRLAWKPRTSIFPSANSPDLSANWLVSPSIWSPASSNARYERIDQLGNSPAERSVQSVPLSKIGTSIREIVLGLIETSCQFAEL